VCQWSLRCFLEACGWSAVARGTREGVLGFVIVFPLFLNKNVFTLYMLLVLIYGMKFYSFFYVFVFTNP
jgi:hypothetical protein